MRVFIRTDASHQIGTGHVMRTLALSGELAAQGAHITFICAGLSGNLLSHIEQRGFEARTIPPGLSWKEDARATLQLIGKDSCDWLVVDHYGISAEWEKAARAGAKKIMVIDDLADRPHDCDVIFDQSFAREARDRYEQLVPAAATRLYGPRFALLRKEFSDARASGALSPDAKVGMVSFGGTDPTMETVKALDAVAGIAGVRWLVVAGRGNPGLDTIRKKCLAGGHELHVQPQNMAELMSHCGFALGAGGTTVWERAALGLPSLVILTAENQRYQTDALAAENYIRYLGDSSAVTVESITRAVSSALQDWNLLRKMGAESATLTDAAGALRVAEELKRLT